MPARLQDVLLNKWVRYAVGPGLLLVGGFVDTMWGKIPLGLAGFLFVLGANVASTTALGRIDASWTLTVLLQNLVTTIEAARPSPADRSLRANIMLVLKKQGTLAMKYSTSNYEEMEQSVQWRRGQGCAGAAWERDEVVVAGEGLPVKARAVKHKTRPWNMTPDQIRATAETIASVMSVPVHSSHGDVVAVLNLDDSEPLNQSLLDQPEMMDAAKELAMRIGSILEQGKLIPD